MWHQRAKGVKDDPLSFKLEENSGARNRKRGGPCKDDL